MRLPLFKASTSSTFILVPLVGYAALWILGSVLFVIYFEVLGVPMNLSYNTMIQRVPAPLAVPTVPLCSLISYFVVTKLTLGKLTTPLRGAQAYWLGLASVVVAMLLDLVITVRIEGLNILVFPVNLMYLLAYLAITPAVVLAWRAGMRKRLPAANTHGGVHIRGALGQTNI